MVHQEKYVTRYVFLLCQRPPVMSRGRCTRLRLHEPVGLTRILTRCILRVNRIVNNTVDISAVDTIACSIL